MRIESVEENSCKDFACDGEQRNTSVIVAGLSVTFILVQVYNRGILKVLWQYPFLPYKSKKLS